MISLSVDTLKASMLQRRPPPTPSPEENVLKRFAGLKNKVSGWWLGGEEWALTSFFGTSFSSSPRGLGCLAEFPADPIENPTPWAWSGRPPLETLQTQKINPCALFVLRELSIQNPYEFQNNSLGITYYCMFLRNRRPPTLRVSHKIPEKSLAQIVHGQNM